MAILCLSVPAASPESKGLRCGPGAILPEPDSPREAMATVSRKVSGHRFAFAAGSTGGEVSSR